MIDKIENIEDRLDGLIHANRHFMNRIEQLTSGPGGIMELKQTIADKEKSIEKLESQFKLYFHAFNKAAARINELEKE